MPEPRSATTGGRGGRPMIMAAHGVVSSGHYLASEIGLRILQRGGNAMDAAAAVGFALAALQPHQNGIGGEAPVLVYSAADRRAYAISGHGTAPRAATIEHFTDLGISLIPGDGLLPAIVPPAVDTWILLLARFGTLRLQDVLGPAVELAEDGFPVYDSLHASIAGAAQRLGSEWPSSARAFMPDGHPPEVGSLLRQPEWAATLKKLIGAARRCRDREQGLRAARDLFYKGEIAERIVEFCRSASVQDASGRPHSGLLALDDMAAYSARVEEPVAVSYRGVDVCKCSTWTQGPVLLQALNLLDGYDLPSLGHNSADYVHLAVECMKLAYADREFYYGDPDFARVPLDRLLSKGYAAERRKLVDAQRASLELRPGGRPPVRALGLPDVNAAFAAEAQAHQGDTTKLEVIDARGNMVSATPSGGWLMSSPVMPGLGFPLGTRGQMFSLAPGHPNCLEPGKRPRTSLTPSLALKGGRPWMAFGSPGGDCQDQWAIQFLLNVVDFGMSLQEAVEAPTFWTTHFPSSFYPRTAEPGKVYVEGRIGPDVQSELAARGHIVQAAGDWSGGNTLAAAIDEPHGVLCAAASPTLDPAYAVGW